MGLWNDSYATGNELVDDDHKSIFMLVESVLLSAYMDRKEKIETAIEFLASYVVRHFANEERLMEASGYPDIDAHKKEHADFLEAATQLQETFATDGFIFGEKNDTHDLHISMIINKTVVGWLEKHVMGSDQLMAQHYREWNKNYSTKVGT